MKTVIRRATLVLVTLTVAACSRPPEITSALQFEASENAPLAGLLRFTTDQPARATLTITDGDNTTTVTPNDTFDTEHELLVLGLRPGRLNTIEVAIESERGEFGEAASVSHTTAPLPDDYPPIDVVMSRPARMEPGFTFVPFARFIDQEFDLDFGLILALDSQGDVVWYFEADHEIDEPRRLSNGNIYYEDFRTGIVEIDMLGNIVARWHATGTEKPMPDGAIPIDTNNFHHDVVEMPSGNFLALSTEPRPFESYPTSEEDADAPWEPATVIGDVLVEFQRDGTKVREWKFFDLMDPYRIGYDSLQTGFYQEVYSEILEEPGRDWSHNNAILYDAESDTAIISSYKQSVLMKLDLGTGEFDWMLGTPEGWSEPWSDLLLEPKGELTWSWHHHAPARTPQGTLLLFDNGMARALPPNPPLLPPETFSRAVEYRIDEAAGTVEEVWSYGGPGDDWFFSGFVSEADWLPDTENILITVGGRVRLPDGTPGVGPFDGHLWVSLMEVTHTTPAERVWEVVIDDPEISWITYRAERMPSLYP